MIVNTIPLRRTEYLRHVIKWAQLLLFCFLTLRKLFLQFATGAGASMEGSNRESVVQREDVHNRSWTTLSGPLGAISARRESWSRQSRLKKTIRFYVIVNISIHHCNVLYFYFSKKEDTNKLATHPSVTSNGAFELALRSLPLILLVGILEWKFPTAIEM